MKINLSPCAIYMEYLFRKHSWDDLLAFHVCRGGWPQAVDTSAVTFNQAQTVEYFSKFLISRLRNPDTNIISGQPWQKPTKRNEFHALHNKVKENGGIIK